MTLQELRSLALAATPGPWKWEEGMGKMDEHNTCGFHYRSLDSTKGEVISSCVYDEHNLKELDAEYIASLDPKTVLRLLDTIENMREALKEISEAISYTESQSTGIKYYHKTGSHSVARECLSRLEKEWNEK